MDLNNQEELIEILGLNIDQSDVESIRFEHVNKKGKDSPGIKSLVIRLKDSHPTCPYCSKWFGRIHAYIRNNIKHSMTMGYPTEIVFERRRYRCPVCGKTWSEPNPFVQKRGKISVNTVINVLQDLKSPTETFTGVAIRYGLSTTTVINLFDMHVNIPRKPLPKYLCIDENYAIQVDRSKYVVILLDFEQQEIVDILPNRFKEDMIHYFLNIPLEERKNVKAVGIDMYRTYKDVAEKVFPNANVCIDRFHLIKLFNEKQDIIRKRALNAAAKEKNHNYYLLQSYRKRTDFFSFKNSAEYIAIKYKYDESRKKYYILKKFSWILAKDKEKELFDANAPAKYNKSLGRRVNYFEIRQLLIKYEVSLSETMYFRDRLNGLYDLKDREKEEEYIDELIQELANSTLDEMKQFSRTMRYWRNEILNSLVVITQTYKVSKDGCVEVQDRRMNNGAIEGKNKIIKMIKNNGNGWKNFPRFRARAMYVINKSDTFALEPIYSIKQLKTEKDKNKKR
jgi:transposase